MWLECMNQGKGKETKSEGRQSPHPISLEDLRWVRELQMTRTEATESPEGLLPKATIQ